MADDDPPKTQDHPREPGPDRRSASAIVLVGGGGIGKTALLGRFFAESVQGYLDLQARVYGFHDLLFHQLPLQEPKPTLATQSIARTVWTLWRDRPERVWALIETWSRDEAWTEDSIDRAHFPNAFLDFGQALFRIGVAENHLETQPALDRLRDWLGAENELRDLSSRILPSLLARMESREVAKIVDEWTDGIRARALGDALARLFQLKPKIFLSLIGKWARSATPQMDTLLIECFEQFEVPELAKARDYHQLEVALRNIRLQLGGSRPPELKRSIDRFIRRLHRKMSEKAGESARLSEGPPRHGPAPQSRSGRRAHPRRGA